MPFFPDENNIHANFTTHVWRDDDDEDGVANPYSTEQEAQEAFKKLEAGGQFQYGGLYRWVHSLQDWDCIDAWPESFDGFDNVVSS